MSRNLLLGTRVVIPNSFRTSFASKPSIKRTCFVFSTLNKSYRYSGFHLHKPVQFRSFFLSSFSSNQKYSILKNKTKSDPELKPNSLLDYSGYKVYISELKKSPGTNLTSFLILHELTSVIPLISIYYFLSCTGFQPITLNDISPEGVESASKYARYVLSKYFGFGPESLDFGSPVFSNLIVSYLIVKSLVPLRLVASAALTPWFSNKVVRPIIDKTKNLLKTGR